MTYFKWLILKKNPNQKPKKKPNTPPPQPYCSQTQLRTSFIFSVLRACVLLSAPVTNMFFDLSWESTHFLNFFPHLGGKKHPAELIWQVSPLSMYRKKWENGEFLWIPRSWFLEFRDTGKVEDNLGFRWKKFRKNTTARQLWKLLFIPHYYTCTTRYIFSKWKQFCMVWWHA